MTEMTGAVLRAHSAEFEIEQLKLAEPKADEVLVRLTARAGQRRSPRLWMCSMARIASRKQPNRLQPVPMYQFPFPPLARLSLLCNWR